MVIRLDDVFARMVNAPTFTKLIVAVEPTQTTFIPQNIKNSTFGEQVFITFVLSTARQHATPASSLTYCSLGWVGKVDSFSRDPPL